MTVVPGLIYHVFSFYFKPSRVCRHKETINFPLNVSRCFAPNVTVLVNVGNIVSVLLGTLMGRMDLFCSSPLTQCILKDMHTMTLKLSVPLFLSLSVWAPLVVCVVPVMRSPSLVLRHSQPERKYKNRNNEQWGHLLCWFKNTRNASSEMNTNYNKG